MAWQDLISSNFQAGGEAAPGIINTLQSINPAFDWTPAVQQTINTHNSTFGSGWTEWSSSPAIVNDILRASGGKELYSPQQIQSDHDRLVAAHAAANQEDDGFLGLGDLGKLLTIGGSIYGLGALGGLWGGAGLGASAGLLDTVLPAELFSLGDLAGFGGFAGLENLGFDIGDFTGMLGASGGSSPVGTGLADLAGYGGESLGMNFGGGSSAILPGNIGGLPEEVWKRLGLGKPTGLSTALNVGSGLYGLLKAAQMPDIAKRAAQPSVTDPFGYGPRAQYASELSALRADPSRIESMPGYKAGLNAVERKMASQGYLGSGNMMAALSQYGGSFFDQEMQRLAQLSGATQGLQVGNQNQALLTGEIAANDLASRALASLGYAARRF